MIPSHAIRRLALAAALFLLALIPFAPGRVAAAIALIGFLPASALAARTPFGLAGRTGLSLVLSPVLFGFIVLAAIALGAPAGAAAWFSAAAWAAVFVAAGPSGPPADVSSGDERREILALAVVFAVAATLSLSLPLSDLWWRVREDSWFQAAVCERLALHGLPIADPYFSPLRLQYMYFYHAILAGAAALAGIDAFHAMILVNALALAGCIAGFAALAGFFARRTGPRALGAALLVFGMNGLFFLFYPIRAGRALFGESAGVELLRAFFPWSPRGHDTASKLLSIEGNQFLFLDKFMLGTAFSLTLGLVCLLLALGLSARAGHRARGLDVAWVVVLAGLLHLHVVVGFSAWLAAVGTTMVLLLSRPDRREAGRSYGKLLGLAFVALALSIPYLASVLPRGGGPGSVRFAVQPGYLVGFLSDLLPALVLAAPFALRAFRGAGGAARGAEAKLVLIWFLGVLAMACVADLPTNNETKFSFLLWIPVCALAAGGIERVWETRRGRRIAVAVVLASTVPLNAVYFFHAYGDGTAFTLTEGERAAYEWIARETPGDAIFLEEDDIVRVPVLAGRDQYWGNETYAFNWGYAVDEIARRRAVRDAVFGASGAGEEAAAALRALGRRVYVVCREKEGLAGGSGERFAGNGRYVMRFAAPDITVFELLID